MFRQSFKDDLVASAVTVSGTSGGATTTAERPHGFLLGELDLIADVTFSGALTSAGIALEHYARGADKWYPAYDGMQQAIEVTFTSTTLTYALLSNQGPARVAHTGAIICGDLWRLSLTATGGIGTSADFTIYARHHERRHNFFHV